MEDEQELMDRNGYECEERKVGEVGKETSGKRECWYIDR